VDDTSLIAALQLADSFFPSGMITLSHGLEAFISLQPQSQKEIARLLEDYLHGKVAPLDLVAYVHAHRAAEAADLERLLDIDRQLTAALLPQEVRQGSARSGRAMLDTVTPLVDSPLLQDFARAVRIGRGEGNAPVCLGLLCVLWQVPLRAGGLVLLYTFTLSFLSTALRLGCLGHREVQRILLAVRPHFSVLVEEALERDLVEMGSFAPLADIRAMQHAYLPLRLFSS
jgi:urease accessory protein